MHPAAASAIASPYITGLCVLLAVATAWCLIEAVRGAR